MAARCTTLDHADFFGCTCHQRTATNLGVNLVVRYVVNAHDRYEIRTRLYQAIVELLHNSRRLAPAEHKTAPVNP